jgi:hypothetical protein
MPRAVLTSKDFWSGLLFMGMGAAAPIVCAEDLHSDVVMMKPAKDHV